jgi:hypothetical protein
MFGCVEINTKTFKTVHKSSLKYARHGHSACSIGLNYIIVTGSKKQQDRAHMRGECYRVEFDLWFDI